MPKHPAITIIYPSNYFMLWTPRDVTMSKLFSTVHLCDLYILRVTYPYSHTERRIWDITWSGQVHWIIFLISPIPQSTERAVTPPGNSSSNDCFIFIKDNGFVPTNPYFGSRTSGTLWILVASFFFSPPVHNRVIRHNPYVFRHTMIQILSYKHLARRNGCSWFIHRNDLLGLTPSHVIGVRERERDHGLNRESKKWESAV